MKVAYCWTWSEVVDNKLLGLVSVEMVVALSKDIICRMIYRAEAEAYLMVLRIFVLESVDLW